MLLPEATNITVRLYSGATLIATSTQAGIANSAWTTYTLGLTTTQTDAITDWTDLRVQIAASKTTARLSWVEFVIPTNPSESMGVTVVGSTTHIGSAPSNIYTQVPYSGSVGDMIVISVITASLPSFPTTYILDDVGNVFQYYTHTNIGGTGSAAVLYIGWIVTAGGTYLNYKDEPFNLHVVFTARSAWTVMRIDNATCTQAAFDTLAQSYTANAPYPLVTAVVTLTEPTHRYQILYLDRAAYNASSFSVPAGWTQVVDQLLDEFTPGHKVAQWIGYRIETPDGESHFTSAGSYSPTPGPGGAINAIIFGIPDRSGSDLDTDPPPLPKYVPIGNGNFTHIRYGRYVEVFYILESALRRAVWSMADAAWIVDEEIRAAGNICASPTLILQTTSGLDSAGFRKILVWEEATTIVYAISRQAIGGWEGISPSLIVLGSAPAADFNNSSSVLMLAKQDGNILKADQYLLAGSVIQLLNADVTVDNLAAINYTPVVVDQVNGQAHICYIDSGDTAKIATTLSLGRTYNAPATLDPSEGIRDLFDIDHVPTIGGFVSAKVDTAFQLCSAYQVNGTWSELVLIDTGVDFITPSIVYDDVSGSISLIYAKGGALYIKFSYDLGRSWS
jgi:hypothetical protein